MAGDRHTDQRYELLERHAPLVLVEVARGGRVLRANSRWHAIAGDELPEDWLDSVAPADRIVVEAAVRQVGASLAPLAIDFRVQCPGALQTWLRATLIPVVELERVRSVICAGIDATREREAEAHARRLVAQLDDSKITLDRIIDATDTFPYAYERQPDGSMVTLLATPGRGRLLGVADHVVDRVDWQSRIVEEDADAYETRLDNLRDGDRYEVEYRLNGLDDVVRWVHDTGYVRHRSDGGLLLVGAMRETTHLRQLQDELTLTLTEVSNMNAELELARAEAEILARTDPLTGLANRRRFTEDLAEILAGGTAGLAMLDIDRFKQINDRHGHAAGDAVLVTVASRLAHHAPQGAVLARVGGEEFVVLLPASESEAFAATVAEQLRLAIRAEPIPVGEGEEITVSASFGVTVADAGDGADAALRRADDALYVAKRTGRDRVVRASNVRAEDMPTDMPEAFRLAQALIQLAGSRIAGAKHPALVADLSARTAEALGADRMAVLRSRLSGWLHDIGKASVPDDILEKPGPLDADEWEVVRRQHLFGERVVRDLPALADAADAVRHLHERFDGTGYPDGLAGELIPLESRIVSVVSAYAAMTQERSYRSAMDTAAAVAELRACAGTQFDPRAVEAFVGILAEDADPARAAA